MASSVQIEELATNLLFKETIDKIYSEYPEELAEIYVEFLAVLTKADKLSRQQSLTRARQSGSQLADITTDRPTVFSARTREGREEIWEKINRLIDG